MHVRGAIVESIEHDTARSKVLAQYFEKHLEDAIIDASHRVNVQDKVIEACEKEITALRVEVNTLQRKLEESSGAVALMFEQGFNDVRVEMKALQNKSSGSDVKDSTSLLDTFEQRVSGLEAEVKALNGQQNITKTLGVFE